MARPRRLARWLRCGSTPVDAGRADIDEEDDVDKTDLTGRVALVTRGSSGLGRATAVALAAAGADVAVLAPGPDNLEHTAEEVRRAGPKATALAVAGDMGPTVRRAKAEPDLIDVPVNAARTDVAGSVTELDVAGWDRALDVDLRTTFLCRRRSSWDRGHGRTAAEPLQRSQQLR